MSRFKCQECGKEIAGEHVAQHQCPETFRLGDLIEWKCLGAGETHRGYLVCSDSRSFVLKQNGRMWRGVSLHNMFYNDKVPIGDAQRMVFGGSPPGSLRLVKRGALLEEPHNG